MATLHGLIPMIVMVIIQATQTGDCDPGIRGTEEDREEKTMKSALKEMLALAERPTSVVLKSRDRQVPTIGEITDRGNQLMENMFGVEESAKTATKNFLANLYPRLSLEPLKWRDKKGYPRLVLFSLNSPIFRIKTAEDGWGWGTVFETKISPKLPKAIRRCYKDVAKMLKKKSKHSDRELKLTCQFNGLIPGEVKEKIEEAAKVFSQGKIFLIAEPQDWKLKTTKVDPLVVGWDGESLHLIADFNTTGVEEAMIFEPLQENKD